MHGRVAEEQGLDPKVYVDQIAEKWREVPGAGRCRHRLPSSARTDEEHKRFVQEFVQRIYDNGDIYEDTYSGLYCVGCEAFKNEDELVDGRPDHGTVPERIEEKNYFPGLSRYQEPPLKLYDERPDFVLPDFRRNEARSFIEAGLEDFSLSRAGQPWGVLVP